MIELTKTVDVKNPTNTLFGGWVYYNKLAKHKRKIYDIITKEFNDFYGDEDRVNQYDWSKVARTSFLNLDFSITNKYFVFEIFKMNNIEKLNFTTNYNKGEILERMIVKINLI